ncbi:hypothetical protein ALI22I_27810 [Saccharothrix sp. ALI-22-I]|uniref:hypothetical protein n=1 Tax=Saccharothrix sp. ALI-22-I TaxID=1933778 RepID=UPI00097BCC5D|nr:hypothetical protein [Saccharothrix sp. ALI-22-I]ONI85588.1 hypothetical protein ALI22I_27810 [Saccharothrix sp. ALI-22-I]
MLDAESGGGAKRIGFIADTVTNVVGDVAQGMVGAPPPKLVATQTQFSVDPEQAQKLIEGLAEARNRLQELNRSALQLMMVPSSAKDPYSAQVVEAIRRTAGNDVGGYGWANTMAYEALTTTIEKIEASLATYRNQDQETADAFNGGGK